MSGEYLERLREVQNSSVQQLQPALPPWMHGSVGNTQLADGAGSFLSAPSQRFLSLALSLSLLFPLSSPPLPIDQSLCLSGPRAEWAQRTRDRDVRVPGSGMQG